MTELPFVLRQYRLAPPPALGVHRIDNEAVKQAAAAWVPDPDRPLEQALPEPWSETYRLDFKQDFQPIVFWRNANIIAQFIETSTKPHQQARARAVMSALLARLEAFTLHETYRAWVENRFDLIQEGVEIRGPWVSALANAFVILGLRRLMDVSDAPDEIAVLIRRYVRPFFTFQMEGGPVQARWFSFITEEGHLWFDEYPMAGGRSNLVLNGHIFALFALNEARALCGQDGLAVLIRGGSHALAENLDAFRRIGKPNVYSLRGTRKSDYLPERTVRQQFEMYHLTGDDRFWTNGVRSAVDCSAHIAPERMEPLLRAGLDRVRARHRMNMRLLGGDLKIGQDVDLPPVEIVRLPRRSFLRGTFRRLRAGLANSGFNGGG